MSVLVDGFAGRRIMSEPEAGSAAVMAGGVIAGTAGSGERLGEAGGVTLGVGLGAGRGVVTASSVGSGDGSSSVSPARWRTL